MGPTSLCATTAYHRHPSGVSSVSLCSCYYNQVTLWRPGIYSNRSVRIGSISTDFADGNRPASCGPPAVQSVCDGGDLHAADGRRQDAAADRQRRPVQGLAGGMPALHGRRGGGRRAVEGPAARAHPAGLLQLPRHGALRGRHHTGKLRGKERWEGEREAH